MIKFNSMLQTLVSAAFVAGASAACAADAPAALAPLQIFTAEGTVAPNLFYLGTPANWASVIPKNGRGPADAGSIKLEPTQIAGKDGVKVTWTGGIGQIYSQSKSAADQMDYVDADGAMVFDAIVHTAPEDQIQMRIDCRYPCMGLFDATEMFKKAPLEKQIEVKIPLACFEKGGTRFTAVNTPFLIFTSKKFALSMANIRWVAGAGKDADAMKCNGS